STADVLRPLSGDEQGIRAERRRKSHEVRAGDPRSNGAELVDDDELYAADTRHVGEPAPALARVVPEGVLGQLRGERPHRLLLRGVALPFSSTRHADPRARAVV